MAIRPRRAWIWAALVFGVSIGSSAHGEPASTAPAAPENLAHLGSGIQRTMTLLATSTPEKRNHVKILFYGQSVTAGPWSRGVADNLRAAYPDADLEIENRAIGGYEAPTLIHPADYDLYPFYPDLLVFHVYGGVETGEQEKIIQRTRQRTTAEVLLWTSHFRWPKDLPHDASPEEPSVQKLWKADEVRAQHIRELAPKYGCELAEVRERLRQHLKDNNLFPKDTLNDSVHPNKLGNFLLEKLMMTHFRYEPKFPKASWQNLTRDIPAKREGVKRGADGSLEWTFKGNRVDVIATHTNDEKLGTARVLVDDKLPSEFPELYYHSRPTAAPRVWWPAINRIGGEKPLTVEKWTARIIECDPEKNVLRYEVSGSKTGPDGSGDHTKPFVSNSGRVVIDPGMWTVCYALRYRKKPLPEDYEVTWKVKPLFADVYQAPKTNVSAKEYATTLAQGLSNSQHTLKLVPNGDGPVPIEAIRVYRPPLE